MSPLRIVELVSIKDTRQWVEDGERWVAIPGSGEIAQCARCGRDHEIHATVRLSGGALAVVGVSCAKATAVEKDVKSGSSSAKTVARLECEIAHDRGLLIRIGKVWETVEDLPMPDAIWGKGKTFRGVEVDAVRVGDAEAIRRSSLCDDEHLCDSAAGRWRENRRAELWGDGKIPNGHAVRIRIEGKAKSLERSKRRLEALTAESRLRSIE